MHKNKGVRIFWAVVGTMVIISMVMFSVMIGFGF
jgi:hypothetical protein